MKFAAIVSIALVALVATTDALPKGKEFAPGCDVFHKVTATDSCESVASSSKITQAQLFEWNNGLHKNCDNLDNGTKVCVGGPKGSPKTGKPKTGKPKTGKHKTSKHKTRKPKTRKHRNCGKD